MIWRFVYNVCGYHHTPIPPLVSPKLKVADPSPLFQNISVCKRLLSFTNLVLRLGKVSGCVKWLCVHCIVGLSSVALCLRNNNCNNNYNLQSINIDNQLYESRLNNYTYNNMILSNITKL